jgi:hypothetical protein
MHLHKTSRKNPLPKPTPLEKQWLGLHQASQQEMKHLVKPY